MKKLSKFVFVIINLIFLMSNSSIYVIILIGDRMSTGCIYNIDIKTNNNETISIPSDYFDHFYIANLDDEGDEINYGYNDDNNLVANFFMIKINSNSNEIASVYQRLASKKDIIGITLCFTNGSRQAFDIPKKRIASKGVMENKYEDIYQIGDDLGIIITDKNIRYKKELFVW